MTTEKWIALANSLSNAARARKNKDAPWPPRRFEIDLWCQQQLALFRDAPPAPSQARQVAVEFVATAESKYRDAGDEREILCADDLATALAQMTRTDIREDEAFNAVFEVMEPRWEYYYLIRHALTGRLE